MKKTKLKRKSKSELRKKTDEADRALQDWYRAKYPKNRCESCGAKFQLMHHFIEKSRSARLRFEEMNLIFLCHKCHASHHRFHDARIMSRVMVRRGAEWLSALMKMEREKGQIHKFIAEQMIEKYKL
jgi:5-methylcytosine-specific restriction endonuclease McrA